MDNNKVRLNEQTAGIAFSAMIMLFLLISIVAQAILVSVVDKNSIAFVIANALLAPVAILTVVITTIKRSKISAKEMMGLQKFHPKFLLGGIFLAVGIFCGFGFVNILIGRIFESLGVKMSGINPPLANEWQFILSCLLFAIIPAVTEEAFFRGVMVKCFGKVNFSTLLIIAGAFALYHGSIAQLIYQFIYGVFLLILVQLSKSTIPAMIVHFLNNFAIIVVEYFNISINMFSPLVIAIGFLSMGVALFILKQSKGREGVLISANFDKQGCKNFFLPFGLFGYVVCIVLALGVFL